MPPCGKGSPAARGQRGIGAVSGGRGLRRTAHPPGRAAVSRTCCARRTRRQYLVVVTDEDQVGAGAVEHQQPPPIEAGAVASDVPAGGRRSGEARHAAETRISGVRTRATSLRDRLRAARTSHVDREPAAPARPGPLVPVGRRLDEALPGVVAAVDRLGARWWFIGPVLCLLLWWPVGWAGVAEPGRVPLAVEDLDRLAAGAVAAGLVAGALVAVDWVAIALTAALSAAGVGLTALQPGLPGSPWGLAASLVVLALGGLVGLAYGPTVRSGILPAATVLALVAALSPWGARGIVLAAAVALPFATAGRGRAVATAVACLRVYVVWLVPSVLVGLLRRLWPGDPAEPVGSAVLGRLSELPARLGDLGAAGVGEVVADAVGWSLPWLVVAAGAAAAVLAVNTLLALGERHRREAPGGRADRTLRPGTDDPDGAAGA